MADNNKTMSADKANAAIEEALTRLERTLLSRKSGGKASNGEQAVYIEQLETKNKQMARDLEDITKHCIALKSSQTALEKKCQLLENINDSAEKELAATMQDLDQLIAQKSLH